MKKRKIRAITAFKVIQGLDRSFFRFVTIHACDGQTDRQTDRLQNSHHNTASALHAAR